MLVDEVCQKNRVQLDHIVLHLANIGCVTRSVVVPTQIQNRKVNTWILNLEGTLYCLGRGGKLGDKRIQDDPQRSLAWPCASYCAKAESNKNGQHDFSEHLRPSVTR